RSRNYCRDSPPKVGDGCRAQVSRRRWLACRIIGTQARVGGQRFAVRPYVQPLLLAAGPCRGSHSCPLLVDVADEMTVWWLPITTPNSTMHSFLLHYGDANSYPTSSASHGIASALN